MCNPLSLKQNSKPFDADFVFEEIDKMIVSCYSFIETTKPREKNPEINYDVIRIQWHTQDRFTFFFPMKMHGNYDIKTTYLVKTTYHQMSPRKLEMSS